MRRTRVIAIALAFFISIGVSALWSAETTKLDGDADAAIVASNGAPTGNIEGEKKGSRFGRIVSAPFRAMGKLFGRGKDDSKLRRLTEKDVAKFETVGAERINDATTEVTARPEASAAASEHLNSGRTLLAAGKYNAAIAELSLAVSQDGSSSEAYGLMGTAFDKKGMSESARTAYEKSLSLNSHNSQILNNLGFLLYRDGNYRAAVDKLKKAAKMSPSDERILNNLGLAQARLGKYDDAYKSFARAGGELTGSINVASLLERAGQYEEALKYYESARRIQPNSALCLRRIADIYQIQGKTEEARSVQQQLDQLAQSADLAKN
jgi:Flp pilus assembly protein TadD